jgi:purine-nucleoside phosphorylase
MGNADLNSIRFAGGLMSSPGTPQTWSSHLDSAQFIHNWDSRIPDLVLVLGSGLGGYAESLKERRTIDVRDIPGFPVQSVAGHKGQIHVGRSNGRTIMVMQGRVHFYECGDVERVLHPVRVFAGIGISTIILTNAAGGLNRSFSPGDLMLIEDQIDLTFTPLRGSPGNERHLPMYDPDMSATALRVSTGAGLPLRKGVYAGMLGPSYETAAEVEMAFRLGADAIGMSTVKESAEAKRRGMRVLGISCITNLGTGIGQSKLHHDEVREVGLRANDAFSSLVDRIVAAL